MLRRRLPLFVLLLLIAVYATLSLRHVGEGERAVRGGDDPKVLAPGWHFVPRGIAVLHRYPAGEARLELGADSPLSVSTREGSEILAAVGLDYRVPAEALAAFHTAAGGDAEGFLRERVRTALERTITDPAWIPLDPGRREALGEHAAGLLRAELDELGVELGGLRIARIGYAGDSAFGPHPQAAVPRKVLWLAIDSFDWDVIDPLMQAGQMPHTAALRARGSWGKLQTIQPVLSPVIWTTMATGKRPEKHGIVDFVATDPASGAVVPVTSTLRKTQAFWNIFGDAGLDTGVIAWWASFPAENVSGFMCTDRIAYQLFKDKFEDTPADDPLKTHPRSLFAEIAPLIRQPVEVGNDELRRYLDVDAHRNGFDDDDRSRVNDLRTVLAATDTYDAIGRKLFAERPVDVQVIYFEAPDTVAHVFMPFVPPAPKIDPQRVAWFGNVVPEIYRRQDELIGEYLERFADDETLVVITSDHGFKRGEERPDTDPRIGVGQAADWHTPDGVVLFAGPDIRAGERILGASVLDVLPTLLTLLGLPVGEDMDGKVLTAAIEPAFLEAHPVATIPTYDLAERRTGDAFALGGESEQELMEKLVSLGYVQQDMPTANINRGTIALSGGNFEDAIAAFRGALAQSDRPAVRLNLARALRLNRQFTEAERELNVLERAGHEPARVLAERSALRRDEGRLGEAQELIEQALALAPDDAEVLGQQARIHELKQDWAAAADAYRRILDADPLRDDALNQLGLMLRRDGRDADAVRVMEDAIARNPDRPAPYNNLGLMFRDMGQPERARRIVEQGVTMAPKSPILRNSLGSIYYESGEHDAAIREFEAALEADPAYAESISNLAVVYQGRKDVDNSVKWLTRLTEVEPDNGDAYVTLALVLFRGQRMARGLEVLETLLQRQPDNLKGRIAIGEALLRQQRASESLAHLERATRLNDGLYRLWNSLGSAYAQVGRRDDARNAFQRSLQLRPEQPQIRRALGELGG